jgi:two-component system chemotaxis sensor kinase CheA
VADRSQKLADFLSEAQETIDALGKDLMRLGAAGEVEPDPDLLNAVFRAAHSLKGLSSMFGVERMARLAHALEDLLDAVRMGRRPLDRAVIDLLLEAPEVCSAILAEEASGAAPRTTDAATRLAERLRATDAPTPQAHTGDVLDTIALAPGERAVLTEYEEHRLRANLGKGARVYRVRVAFPLETFDVRLGEISSRLKSVGEVVSTLPSREARDPATIAFELLCASSEPKDELARLAGKDAEVDEIPRVGAGPPVAAVPPPPAASAQPPAAGPPAPSAALSPVPEPPAEPEHASLRSASQAVRVDIRKLDRLMNVVGELVLVKASLLRVAERLRSEGGDPVLTAELQRESRALERRLAELQEGVLEVRMVPLEQVFDKLARMVRKVAREVGKEIDFEVRGGDVQLDKLIVEDLSDPLMHIIRNAIDHGIEAPEVRERLGKPRAGKVTLSAVQRGNHARIVVEDDGAGVDEDRVREVAIARGIATPDSVREMSRREIVNLVFEAGFSTARTISALSGRGVGLDVVKNNVAELSGIIDLQTERARGTRFEITLPVTLAIIRALVVSVAGRVYALPLSGVLEIVEVRAADVRTLSSREVISLRGSTLPLVRLGKLFSLSGARAPDTFFVAVVGIAQERLGIAVDELVAQQDIVVKPLGGAVAGVRGIAGATDLGSRRTVLVLDVGAILEEVLRGDGLREVV